MGEIGRLRVAARFVMAAGVLIVLAVASGCGGGDSSSGATPQGGSATDGSAQGGDFASCLREHGVENFGRGAANEMSAEDRAALQSAMSECRDLAPAGGGQGGGLPQVDSAQSAKYQACLRKNGVTGFGGAPGQNPPADPSGGAPQGGPGSLSDADRKKLEAAMKECGDLAPEGFGRPGGGNPGAGGAQNAEYRKCMAEHGVTLGQPGSGGDDAFRVATEACGKLLAQSSSGGGS